MSTPRYDQSMMPPKNAIVRCIETNVSATVYLVSVGVQKEKIPSHLQYPSLFSFAHVCAYAIGARVHVHLAFGTLFVYTVVRFEFCMLSTLFGCFLYFILLCTLCESSACTFVFFWALSIMCQGDMLRNRKRERRTPISVKDTGYSLTRAVVSHHRTANDAWVIYRGCVYDVTVFLESHPGGADIMLDKLGGDVTDVMSDEKGVHVHSVFAYKLLEKYKIGNLLDADDDVHVCDGNVDPLTGNQLVDWHKPILHQVGMLGDKYSRWIHSFPTTDSTVKMFSNDTLESLTKCPWYIPLLFWIPIILFELIHYLRLIDGVSNVKLFTLMPMAILGVLSWLLFEYTLHRYVFHLSTNTYYANIFHFLIHGHHHITPMDFDRLVFPPVPALILALPFWVGAPRILGIHAGYPWLIGFAIGYLVYDMTHFWIHYGVPKWSFLKMQKRRHIFHHYFQPDVNYGISNPLFDHVFSTITEPAM